MSVVAYSNPLDRGYVVNMHIRLSYWGSQPRLGSNQGSRPQYRSCTPSDGKDQQSRRTGRPIQVKIGPGGNWA